MRRIAVGSAVVLASIALAALSTAAAQPARVIDRTVVCAAALSGGINEVEVRAQAGAGRRGSIWQKPAIAMVTTGSTGSASEALDNALAWVTAGQPSRTATVIPDPFVGFTYPIGAWGTLAMAERCNRSQRRPALSTKGLRGGRVDGLGEVFDCPSPRRVLMRVRAVLSSATALRTRRGYLATTTAVTEGQVVVTTEAGKSLAYAEVSASGKARLFTAQSCVPD